MPELSDGRRSGHSGRIEASDFTGRARPDRRRFRQGLAPAPPVRRAAHAQCAGRWRRADRVAASQRRAPADRAWRCACCSRTAGIVAILRVARDPALMSSPTGWPPSSSGRRASPISLATTTSTSVAASTDVSSTANSPSPSEATTSLARRPERSRTASLRRSTAASSAPSCCASAARQADAQHQQRHRCRLAPAQCQQLAHVLEQLLAVRQAGGQIGRVRLARPSRRADGATPPRAAAAPRPEWTVRRGSARPARRQQIAADQLPSALPGGVVRYMQHDRTPRGERHQLGCRHRQFGRQQHQSVIGTGQPLLEIDQRSQRERRPAPSLQPGRQIGRQGWQTADRQSGAGGEERRIGRARVVVVHPSISVAFKPNLKPRSGLGFRHTKSGRSAREFGS